MNKLYCAIVVKNDFSFEYFSTLAENKLDAEFIIAKQLIYSDSNLVYNYETVFDDLYESEYKDIIYPIIQNHINKHYYALFNVTDVSIISNTTNPNTYFVFVLDKYELDILTTTNKNKKEVNNTIIKQLLEIFLLPDNISGNMNKNITNLLKYFKENDINVSNVFSLNEIKQLLKI